MDGGARRGPGGLPVALSLLEDGAHAGHRGHADPGPARVARVRGRGDHHPQARHRGPHPAAAPARLRRQAVRDPRRALGRAGDRRGRGRLARRGVRFRRGAVRGAGRPDRREHPGPAESLVSSAGAVPGPLLPVGGGRVESASRPARWGAHRGRRAQRARRAPGGPPRGRLLPRPRHPRRARPALRHRPRGMRAHRARPRGGRAHLRRPGPGAGGPRALCRSRGHRASS